MSYLSRALEPKLQEYIEFFSVVGLTGPRQSGKSTLLKNILPHYQYVTFDDFRITSLFYEDPEKFMEIYSGEVIFDEIQKVPELFEYIKLAVDNDREKTGKFVLSGSSQFHLLKNISESLAGRIGLLSLLPFQYNEVPTALQEKSLYLGGYPELLNKQYAMHQDWFSAYLDTYLHKDVRSLNNVGNLRDFQRFITLLAMHTAQVFDASSFAKDIGVSVSTIKQWASILEASYIIFFYRLIMKILVSVLLNGQRYIFMIWVWYLI